MNIQNIFKFFILVNFLTIVESSCNVLNCLSAACSGSTCNQCMPYYFLNIFDQCQNCPQGCPECNSASSCLQCDAGYYVDQLKSGSCSQCSLGDCKTCSGAYSCTSCNDGWTMYKGRCVTCANKAGCAECNDRSCTKCSSGYYLFNGRCNKCDESCPNCNQTYFCNRCESEYQFFGICIPSCPEPNFYANETSCFYICPDCQANQCSNGACLMCDRGYFPDETGICQLCVFGCDICNDFAGCVQCSDGYYYNSYDKSCHNCLANCKICNSSSKCELCNPGYYLLHDTCSSFCPSQYYYANGSVCYPRCEENCLNCSNGVCLLMNISQSTNTTNFTNTTQSNASSSNNITKNSSNTSSQSNGSSTINFTNTSFPNKSGQSNLTNTQNAQYSDNPTIIIIICVIVGVLIIFIIMTLHFREKAKKSKSIVNKKSPNITNSAAEFIIEQTHINVSENTLNKIEAPILKSNEVIDKEKSRELIAEIKIQLPDTNILPDMKDEHDALQERIESFQFSFDEDRDIEFEPAKLVIEQEKEVNQDPEDSKRNEFEINAPPIQMVFDHPETYKPDDSKAKEGNQDPEDSKRNAFEIHAPPIQMVFDHPETYKPEDSKE